MKNKEFYKDKIFEAACKYNRIAVNKETGEPCECRPFRCNKCALSYHHGNGTCLENWIHWLEEEHVEPILDKVEKKYLESVIAPFRKRVQYIKKISGGIEAEFLAIRVKSCLNNRCESIHLPYFYSKKMYKGMEASKEYTLEELGLFQEDDHVADQ